MRKGIRFFSAKKRLNPLPCLGVLQNDRLVTHLSKSPLMPFTDTVLQPNRIVRQLGQGAWPVYERLTNGSTIVA